MNMHTKKQMIEGLVEHFGAMEDIDPTALRLTVATLVDRHFGPTAEGRAFLKEALEALEES